MKRWADTTKDWIGIEFGESHSVRRDRVGTGWTRIDC